MRDILITEIMNIESSQFEKEAIDMDAISFARKQKSVKMVKMAR